MARQRASKAQTRPNSRSFPPEEVELATGSHEEIIDDDVFFDASPPLEEVQPTRPEDVQDNGPIEGTSTDGKSLTQLRHQQRVSFSTPRPQVQHQGAWKRASEQTTFEQQSRPSVGASRVWANLLDGALDNSDRRQYGMGWVGRTFG